MWSETASPVRYYNTKRPPLYKTPRRSQPRSPPICPASSAAARGAASALGAVYCIVALAPSLHALGRPVAASASLARNKKTEEQEQERGSGGWEGHSATRRSLATIEGSTTRRSHATTTIGGSSTTGRSLATTGVSTTKRHWEGP